MTGALVGTAVGLLGVVVALFYRSQLMKARGDAHLLSLKLDHENEEHDETLQRAQENADEYIEDLEAKEQVIAYYKLRAQEASERRLSTATHGELHDDANRLFENEDGGEVENEDNHTPVTVPNRTTPE